MGLLEILGFNSKKQKKRKGTKSLKNPLFCLRIIDREFLYIHLPPPPTKNSPFSFCITILNHDFLFVCLYIFFSFFKKEKFSLKNKPVYTYIYLYTYAPTQHYIVPTSNFISFFYV